MKRALTIVLVLTLCVVAVWYFQPRFMIRWLAQMDRDGVYYFETDKKVVALTIDDGPHARVTPEILDVLQEHNAHATFFVLGERVAGNEAILDRMHEEQHEIANHLLADYPSILVHRDQFELQLLKVQADAGIDTTRTKWFRPGHGWYNKPMKQNLARHSYRLCLASVYPRDTMIRSVKAIAWYVLRKVQPGDVIILHDGQDDRMRTVKALRAILPELKKRGYEVVTLGELEKQVSEQ